MLKEVNFEELVMQSSAWLWEVSALLVTEIPLNYWEKYISAFGNPASLISITATKC